MARAQAAQHFEAVDSRQADIEHNQIERFVYRMVQRFFTIMNHNRVVSGLSQRRSDVPRQTDFIFDNKNVH